MDLVTGSRLGSVTCSLLPMGCAHTPQTNPKFNGFFFCLISKNTIQSKCREQLSLLPALLSSCPRCSSLFPVLSLPLFPAGCSLHGPCRCPELAQPLQAPGSRFLNKMLSFQPSRGRAGSAGSSVHMWGSHTWSPLQPC